MCYQLFKRCSLFFFGLITYSFSSVLDQNIDSNAFDTAVDTEKVKHNQEQQKLPSLENQEIPGLQLLIDDDYKEADSSVLVEELGKIESKYNKLPHKKAEKENREMDDLFIKHLKICILLLSRNEIEPGYLCEYFGYSPWQETIRKMIKLDGEELSEGIAYATGVYLCGFVLFKNGQTSEGVSSLYKNAIDAASLKQRTDDLLEWAIFQAKNDQATPKLAVSLKPVLDFVKNFTCLDK